MGLNCNTGEDVCNLKIKRSHKAWCTTLPEMERWEKKIGATSSCANQFTDVTRGKTLLSEPAAMTQLHFRYSYLEIQWLLGNIVANQGRMVTVRRDCWHLLTQSECGGWQEEDPTFSHYGTISYKTSRWARQEPGRMTNLWVRSLLWPPQWTTNNETGKNWMLSLYMCEVMKKGERSEDTSSRRWGVYVPEVTCNPQANLVRQRRGRGQCLTTVPRISRLMMEWTVVATLLMYQGKREIIWTMGVDRYGKEERKLKAGNRPTENRHLKEIRDLWGDQRKLKKVFLQASEEEKTKRYITTWKVEL